jgi:hypothetical protein
MEYLTLARKLQDIPDPWPAFLCTDFDEGCCLLKHRRCTGRLDCEWYDGSNGDEGLQ